MLIIGKYCKYANVYCGEYRDGVEISSENGKIKKVLVSEISWEADSLFSIYKKILFCYKNVNI